jgi:hypothetical protein
MQNEIVQILLCKMVGGNFSRQSTHGQCQCKLIRRDRYCEKISIRKATSVTHTMYSKHRVQEKQTA